MTSERRERMAQVTLAGARVSKGWTQQELADKMGVSRNTVIFWETGRRTMKRAHLYMFCGLTGFKEEDILLPESTLKCTEGR